MFNRQQFKVLYRVFLLRVVDLEALAADADTTKLLAQFGTVLGSLSFLFCWPLFLMVGLKLNIRFIWTTEHFFLATQMVAVGVISLLCWDQAFPDRRDIMVLGTLPVAPRTFFAAKTCALLTAPALTMLTLNACSGLSWPLLFSGTSSGPLGHFAAWPAWWITLILSGFFIFASVLTLQGIAANLLPRQWFLRLSALLQAIILSGVLITYFLEPSMESRAALAAAANHHLLAWLPTYWFLGLFQQLNGSLAPEFVWLAHRAWIATAMAGVGAATSILLAYTRLTPKIVEQPEIVPAVRGMRFQFQSIDAALALFLLRTLTRSRQHRMIFSFYVGIGAALAIAYVRTPFANPLNLDMGISVAAIAVTLLIVALSIAAVRIVGTLPMNLRANWIFHITELSGLKIYRRALRRSYLTLVVAPCCVIAASITFVLYRPLPSAQHLFVLILWGGLLTEIALLGMRKIPFTCSYLPGKSRIHFAFYAGVVTLAFLLGEGAKVEARAMSTFGQWLILVCTLASIWLIVRWTSEANTGDALLFEETEPPIVVSLGLQ